MDVRGLQIRARDEWFGSNALQREFATPEFYWSEEYQPVYCPDCPADFMRLCRVRTSLSEPLILHAQWKLQTGTADPSIGAASSSGQP
jgi:hypothetical protein